MAPDPALTAEALILVQAQAQTREQISTATQAGVAAAIRAFLTTGSRPGAAFYDATAITRLAKQLAATTRAGQRSTSTSTAAYWSRLVQLLTGQRSGRQGGTLGSTIKLIDPAAVRPVPLESVYGRLADQYRWLQASRGPESAPEDRLRLAVEAHDRQLRRLASTTDRPDAGVPVGRPDSVLRLHLGDPNEQISAAELARRLDELVAANPAPTVAPDPLSDDEIADRVIARATSTTDSLLSETMRAQIEQAAKADPKSVTGYRRVLHPEVSVGGSCGLCIVASDRVYRRGNLLPLHERCACSVTPLIGEPGGDGDVGSALNASDLAALYDAAGSTAAADLKRTKWRVLNHPEKGPILTAAGGSIVTLLPQGG